MTFLSEHRYIKKKDEVIFEKVENMRIKEVMNVKTFSLLISNITKAFIFETQYINLSEIKICRSIKWLQFLFR